MKNYNFCFKIVNIFFKIVKCASLGWNFNACCSCCRRHSKKDDEKTVIKDARDLHGNLAFNNNGIGNNGYGATMTGESPQEAYREGLAIQNEVYFTRI